MTAKLFATLDPNALGPELALDQGNLVVMSEDDNLDGNRVVFATLAKGIGRGRVDAYFYSDSRGDFSTLAASFGFCRPSGSIETYCGADDESYGLLPFMGGVWHNGVKVVDGPPVTERRCISLVFNADHSFGPVAIWYVDGNFYGYVELPPDSSGNPFWVPAIGTGGPIAEDLRAFLNFGQRPFDGNLPPPAIPGWDTQQISYDGWYEINTEGLSTIRLTAVDEGLVTLSTDSDPSAVYKARILNPESFSIKNRPLIWPWGDTSNQFAAYGQLQIEDYDGFFDYLVGADLRDQEIVIQLPPAMAFGTTNLLRDAPIIATAILDNVTADSEDTKTITIKDKLTRLDKALPAKLFPPFVDAGAANRMVPISLGACRNVQPILKDSVSRTYIAHDAALTNVARVADMYAPLDPHATPPQYTPAENSSGVQLETDPVGKVTMDCSSVGQQVVIPGAEDVLNGAGDFASWDAGSPSVPNGWDWSNHPGSLILRREPINGYPEHTAELSSSIPWYPQGNKYGDQLSTETEILEAGAAYRIIFKIYSTFSSISQILGGRLGGIMVRSALSNNPDDAISDHGVPLTVPLTGDDSFVYEYRVPAGADRKLYFIATAADGATPGTGNLQGGGYIHLVSVEKLGEYTELPLTGITLSQIFPELLVVRGGEKPDGFSIDNIVNTEDLAALDAATGYELGVHYDEPPNLLQAQREIADSYHAALYGNNLGVSQVKQLSDPKDGTPIADFDETNIVAKSLTVAVDDAPYLTNTAGTTRNWSPGQDSDFVTDTAIVPAEIRTRYKKVSQFTLTSSVSVAGQYAFSKNQPMIHLLLVDPGDGQREIDAVNSLWAPRVYSDGTVGTGKRRFITWATRFDDPAEVGATLKADLADFGFNTVVILNRPDRGFDNTSVAIVGWEIFPFAKRIVFTGWC